jgi:PHD/YefM family antitoxin component YafN of YafNO toxin-antitoxin module
MSIFDGRNANLSAEADLNAIQETIYLLSVPGMRESIKAGLTESPEDLAKSLDWEVSEHEAMRSARSQS